MANDSVKVVFTPSGKRGAFPRGTSLLEAARRLGVDLDSVCGGRGLCGRCQILPMAGSFAKHKLESKPENLGAFTETEARYEARKGKLKSGRRLGCHALLQGDLVIDVPPESQVRQQVIRKEADARELTLAPNLRLYAIQVEEPQLESPSGDLQRVLAALAREWQLSPKGAHPALLSRLQPTLREGSWFVTAALDASGQLRWLWPGLKEQVYGLAIDLGSTTIAAHLCSLQSGAIVASASRMNPQIRFGEDLMSRVSYLMMQPEQAGELTRVVREAVNEILVETTGAAGIEAEDVLELSLVANPIMHHLFLGLSPVELGSAPFALATSAALTLDAAPLGLTVNPAASLYALPCIAGHVGADAAGMVLAEAPESSSALTLLVDVGTNAEIMLGSSERLLACSSPTGPAFEGAEISCGQRAAPGAIERVRIDRETLEPRIKVIGCDDWSDSPGFNAEVTGICGSGIIDALAEMYLAGIITEDGIIRGDLAQRATQPEAASDSAPASEPENGGSPHSADKPEGASDSAPASEPENGGSPHSADKPEGASDPGLASKPDSAGKPTGASRIVQQGRTWAYLLHKGPVDVLITQNDVRQVQLAKAALYAGVKLLMQRLGVDKVERIRLAGAFGSHIDVARALAIGLVPDCPLDQVASAGNAAGTGALMALLNTEARTAIEATVERIEKLETATEPAFQAEFVAAMNFPHSADPFPNLFTKFEKPPQPTPSAPQRRRRQKAATSN